MSRRQRLLAIALNVSGAIALYYAYEKCIARAVELAFARPSPEPVVEDETEEPGSPETEAPG